MESCLIIAYIIAFVIQNIGHVSYHCKHKYQID